MVSMMTNLPQKRTHGSVDRSPHSSNIATPTLLNKNKEHEEEEEEEEEEGEKDKKIGSSVEDLMEKEQEAVSSPPSKRIRCTSQETDLQLLFPKPIPIDPSGPLYTHGTQYRFWRFSANQVEMIRHQVNQLAIQDVLELLREHSESSWTPADFLTPQEEYELIQHFMEQSVLVCRKFKLNDLVRATALMCMRRFYLKKSVLFYDPKTVMLTCLFLASKIENSIMKLDDLVQGVKALNKMELKELEFVVSETLQFQFWIRHPFEASFGIFLDCQETMDSVDLALLWDTWKRAGGWICTSMFTDTGLRFMPSQVAMACWQLASQRTLFPFHVYLQQKQVKYLGPFKDTPSLHTTLDTIAQVLQAYSPVPKDRAMRIMQKLETMRQEKARITALLNTTAKDEATEENNGDMV